MGEHGSCPFDVYQQVKEFLEFYQPKWICVFFEQALNAGIIWGDVGRVELERHDTRSDIVCGQLQ